MNLAADKWIPVVCLDGQHDEVSLATAFTEGHRIADLAVRPPERIALMRLLLCVAHAALDPTGKDPRPRDQDDWHDCRDELATKAGAYMQRWASAFELLDGDARFLQVQKLVLAVARQGGKNRKSDSGGGGADEGKFVDKLDIFLAAGTNTTLFDNAGGSERSFTLPRLAMMLLTFQSFSVPARWAWPCGTVSRPWARVPRILPRLTPATPFVPLATLSMPSSAGRRLSKASTRI